MVPALLFFPISLYVGHVPPHMFSGGFSLAFKFFFPFTSCLPHLMRALLMLCLPPLACIYPLLWFSVMRHLVPRVPQAFVCVCLSSSPCVCVPRCVLVFLLG